jgi:glycosyltransferase involved in cell wall biosynthesis
MELLTQIPPPEMAEVASVRPMRIALVTETFLPKIDGIVTRLTHTIRHLVEFGHQVFVIAPRGVDEHAGARVHGVSGIPFPPYPELKLAPPRPSLTHALERFQPDLIHAINPAVLGISAFLYSNSHRVPLVVSYHTHLPKYLRFYGASRFEPILWSAMRAAYNKADLTLATSAVMQQELESHGIRRVQLWRRGVDTGLFHPSRATAAMRFRLTQGHPEEKLLLYIGRLGPEKEIERIRDVLASLPGVRLALVGDGPVREKLERHFAGTPTFFAGFLRDEELASAYASGDAFFLASRTETLGLVLMEAMAAGCPVVAPRAGGVSDIIHDGVTGNLYDPDRTSDAVDAVARLLFDPDHHAQMSRAARRDAEQWGWTAATRQLERYYQDVLDREQRLPAEIAEMQRAGIREDALCDQLAISRQTFRRHAAR